MTRPRIRDDLAMMPGYHSPQVDVAVRLNTNEAPEPPPAGFRDAFAAEVSRVDWHRYPDRSASLLREALAKHHQVDASMVFAANGSNEILQALLLAYGGPGRTAMTFEPTYALHSHISKVTGTGVIEVERDDNFGMPPELAAKAIEDHQPSVVFLCSPNNPTGVVEPRELIEASRKAAQATGSLLIVDEAYGQFADWSAQELLGEDVNLVVSRTFSKTWSMAAARLGYLLAPSWVCADLEQVILPYHLDAVKQVAGRLALDYEAEMNERVAQLVAQRQVIMDALEKLPVKVWPSSANFVLFRPESKPGGQVWDALLEHSVLVRNCASWPRLDGCLRVTVGTAAENRAFLAALSEIL